MNKVKKFIKSLKEYYKIIIPLALILVLFIAFFIYYKVSILDNKTYDIDGNFYQYFYGEKYEYKGIVSTNRKGVIVGFKTDDYDIKFDSTPIYYKNKKEVIFPKDMSVVMPTLNCSEYKALGYSSLTYKKGNYTLSTDKYTGKLGRYFLYDGNDLYFFLDEVDLVIGNKKISLSSMSYVVAKYNNSIAYYDYDNDKYEIINVDNSDIYVENDFYKIYVLKDQLDYYDTEVILTSKISELNSIAMKDRG
jgi:hypothetical protein